MAGSLLMAGTLVFVCLVMIWMPPPPGSGTTPSPPPTFVRSLAAPGATITWAED